MSLTFSTSDVVTVSESVTLSSKPRLTVEYSDDAGSTWYEITQYCPLLGDMFLSLPPVRTEAVRESNTGLARFGLNATGAALISEGDEVRITDGISFYFFGGHIARIEEVRRGTDTGAIVECQDYNGLMDRTIVVNYSIDAGDDDATEIGTLLSTYLSDISTGQIDTLNATMEAVTLLGTFRDCIAKIAGQANGDVHFWIDFEKNFYYVESRQDVAGAGGNVTLSDVLGGGNEPYGSTRRIIDNTRKVDRVYVQGDGASGWVGSGDYEAIINDNSVTTAAGVTELGTTITTRRGSATEEYRIVTWEPDAYGEFYLTFAHSNFHSSATIDVRRAVMTPRSADGTEYEIILELGEYSVDTDNIGGGSSRGVLTPGGSRGGGVDITIGTRAPDDAQYVTLAVDDDLSAERVLTSGNGLAALADGGANGNVTVSLGTPSTLTLATTNNVTATSHTHELSITTGAPDDAQYVTLALDGDLSAERVLTAGDGIDLTDGGANGNATVAVDVTDIIGNGITESSNNIVLGTPSTLTVSTSNGVTASSHTHAITSSSNPGAAASILATPASGTLTLRGLIIGANDCDLNNNDLILDLDGDTYLHCPGIDDEVSLVLGGTQQYNFDHDQLTIYNTGGTALLWIRTHGDVQSTAADILGQTQLGLAAQTDCYFFIDSDNNGTTSKFAVERNAETVSGGTEIFRVQENGQVGVNLTSPVGKLGVDQSSSTGAIPVLYLRQQDVDREFIRFRGSASNGVLARSIVDYGDESSSTAAVWLRVYVSDDGNQVTDTYYHILAYTLA